MSKGKTTKKGRLYQIPVRNQPTNQPTHPFYQPNCSQCSSTAGPSPTISFAVVSLTTLISPSGPHAATSTLWFRGVVLTASRISDAASGRPALTGYSKTVRATAAAAAALAVVVVIVASLPDALPPCSTRVSMTACISFSRSPWAREGQRTAEDETWVAFFSGSEPTGERGGESVPTEEESEWIAASWPLPPPGRSDVEDGSRVT